PHLTKAKLDRVELDPAPIRLAGQRSPEEIEAIVARRLQVLYDQQGVEADGQSPTFPFRPEDLRPLANLRTRDVLEGCRRHHERCILARAGVAPAFGPAPVPAVAKQLEPQSPAILPLEQVWNDFHAAFKGTVPDDEADLAHLLAWALGACSEE